MISDKDVKYLGMCYVGGKMFSTCAKRNYMSIILSDEGRIVATGYNGSPPGQGHCIDGACPRYQQGTQSGVSYDNCIAVHAEQNALIWSDRGQVSGGTLYVNGVPCSTCAKLIAGSGIKRVVNVEDPAYIAWETDKAMLESSGIVVDEVDEKTVLQMLGIQTGWDTGL